MWNTYNIVHGLGLGFHRRRNPCVYMLSENCGLQELASTLLLPSSGVCSGHGCGVGGRIVRKQLLTNSVPGGPSLTARGAWSLGPASCLDSASSDLEFTLPYHF